MDDIKLYVGDCVDVLDNKVEEESVDMALTSPPYDNLRDYKGYCFDYRRVLKSIYRVLKKGGVCVWVVGDATIDGGETGTSFKQALCAIDIGFLLNDTMIYRKNSSPFPSNINSPRYSQAFEYMFVFSKGRPATVNLIKDKLNKWGGSHTWGEISYRSTDGNIIKKDSKIISKYAFRENIWEYNTGYNSSTPDKIAYSHPAIFPEKLAKDHILSWSNEGDVVLDPMCGSGTTVKVARLLGRKAIGIDSSEEYIGITKKRLYQNGGHLF